MVSRFPRKRPALLYLGYTIRRNMVPIFRDPDNDESGMLRWVTRSERTVKFISPSSTGSMLTPPFPHNPRYYCTVNVGFSGGEQTCSSPSELANRMGLQLTQFFHRK